ncbi:MAG: dihydrofolate reductase family protein [Solirubrobacterales bacterium]
MGKVVVTEFVSVDGVFEDPGGSEGTDLGAWTFEFDRGDDGNKFKLDETMASDALLLGRVTYEGFADAWPNRSGDEFSDKFNNMPKYVVSSTLKDPEWNNSTVIGADLENEVPKLKEQHEGEIAVHGSGQLARALLDQGLVDEVRLMVFPVVLGRGRQLFDGIEQHTLKLADSKPVGPDGIVVLTYEPAEQK